MRRGIIVVLAFMALLGTAQPANAQHAGTWCDSINLSAIDNAMSCVTVNIRDCLTCDDIEALAWFNSAPSGVRVQFDWVHLFRWRPGTDGQDQLFRWTGGPSGWLAEGASYSTNWGNFSCDWVYQARMRWRAKRANGTVTGYSRQESRPVQIC